MLTSWRTKAPDRNRKSDTWHLLQKQHDQESLLLMSENYIGEEKKKLAQSDSTLMAFSPRMKSAARLHVCMQCVRALPRYMHPCSPTSHTLPYVPWVSVASITPAAYTGNWKLIISHNPHCSPQWMSVQRKGNSIQLPFALTQKASLLEEVMLGACIWSKTASIIIVLFRIISSFPGDFSTLLNQS